MQSLFQFTLNLLAAYAPWLAAVIVTAVAVAVVGPIKLTLVTPGDQNHG
jgi:hypothetical protein